MSLFVLQRYRSSSCVCVCVCVCVMAWRSSDIVDTLTSIAIKKKSAILLCLISVNMWGTYSTVDMFCVPLVGYVVGMYLSFM